WIQRLRAMAAVLPSEKRSVDTMIDRAGICVSTLCLIQCLLLPIIVIAVPALSVPFLDSEAFHLLLLGLILPVGIIAFYLGYRVHANRATIVIGLTGLGVVLLTAILGHDHLSPIASALWTSLGGVLLISAHLLNLHHRRRVCLGPGADDGSG
ncbi:MAG: MerC domain-containing protein, partial [Wenzhouxiangella sp.]|nr:MerC domain-containing protein [Wenzhouxiangella sp.]